LLLEFPNKHWELLETLGEHFTLFLLSNTNSIHISRFYHTLDETVGRTKFINLFQKIYYSHEIGYRKPDLEAYRFVLKHQQIHPGEMLFFDDLEANLTGAKKTGINVQLVNDNNSILKIFKEYLEA
jgi:FMN phosphatase YigB (HAD superfamily)